MPRTTRRVSAEILRTRFNDDQIWERVEAGELVAVDADQRPAPAARNQPPGTVSVMIHIYTRDLHKVAVAHCYRLPDGSIGASGRPDPKKLHVDDEIWLLEPGHGA
jgi:hypothetical protein